jgi:serine/threonine protein kinase
VQIFLPLYHGSVDSLLPRHHCDELPAAPASWIPTFIDNILSALDYMHGRGIIHRDLKPGNILYSGSHDRPKSFCISDLGLGVSEWSVDRHRIAGTVVYMAPETSRRGRTSAASDVYSFGIVLLELLGIYCHREGEPERYSVSAWRRKLRLLGAAARDAERYTDKPASRDDEVPEVQVAHSRLKSLVDCRAVPRALAAVLEENPGRRASAADARQPLKTTYSGAAPALAGRPREADRARERDVAPFAPPALRRRHTGGMTVRTDMTGRTGITRLTGMTGRPRVVRFDLPIRAR